MSNTYSARRGNKIVRIDEDCIEKYKAAGYTITDANGSVIASGTPHNVNQLSSAYEKLTNDVKQLTEQVNKLTAQLNSAKAENSKLKAELDKFKSAPINEPKPRKRKQATTEAEEVVKE